MAWRAELKLDYTRESQRSVARYLHQGPLRILQSLYPEGDQICHNVLVHPPGGLVGGDTLDIQVNVAEGAHALVSTPSATRFYKSGGQAALQQVTATLAPGSRLEWLPLEAIAYNDCEATNRAIFNLAPTAELMAWDVTALGLPSSDMAFAKGHFQQHLEIPGVWLERGNLRGDDTRWLNSPLGLAGQKCLASLVFASGHNIEPQRAAQALEASREVLEAHPLRLQAGITCAHPQVIVLRVMSPLVEPSMDLLKKVWAVWRHTLWALPSTPPRIWSV
ncbi:MAG: urease accessory protein UreD [Burkholderiales bacterium]|nr:urease accessory protein UreD [Burkholderiales bacterium]